VFLFLVRNKLHWEAAWKRFFKASSRPFEHYSLLVLRMSNATVINTPFFQRRVIDMNPPHVTRGDYFEAAGLLLRSGLLAKENKRFVFLSDDALPLKHVDNVVRHFLGAGCSTVCHASSVTKRNEWTTLMPQVDCICPISPALTSPCML
jgi:hypothetical protein